MRRCRKKKRSFKLIAHVLRLLMSYLLNLKKTTVSKRTTLPRTADYIKGFLKDWENFREYHIGGDFLLIYKLSDSSKISEIVFVRAGTHSELFD
ncbi:type II toxin-antitoxin system mRNA interferase toxin, RelE/StbE family [Yersinia sp. HM-2024]|uniref:type II toxin-antitoxin system mRNA interferase toxin, RelE/StbE family n=1 Tax=Yersinia sp. HM-2024 TaxID=3344550 RepID=UPI00370DD6C5